MNATWMLVAIALVVLGCTIAGMVLAEIVAWQPEDAARSCAASLASPCPP